MTLFIHSQDVATHIQQLEERCGFSGYDHFFPEERGWCNEMEMAEMKAHGSKIRMIEVVLATIRGWVSKNPLGQTTGDFTRQDI